MKLFPLILISGAAALMLCGCAEQNSEPELPAETTTAVTTETTAPETTTETTTTTTTQPYILAEELSFAYVPASARPTSCTATLTNNGGEDIGYGSEFHVYDMEGKEMPYIGEGEQTFTSELKTLAAGESAELQYDWSGAYGELAEGSYILEQVINSGAEIDEETGETKQGLPTVCRTVFSIVGSEYAPILTIAPENVATDRCVLNVQNAPDQPRDYTLVWRLYDSENHQILREIDFETQRAGTYHFEAGENHDLNFYWKEIYGNLPDGNYELELDFLGDTDKVTTTYRVPFTVNGNTH